MKQFEYDRKEVIQVVRLLNELVVSLDRIGAAWVSKEEGSATLADFVVQHRILQKCAEARAIMEGPFSRELGPDDMDELEREMEDVPYWSSIKSMEPWSPAEENSCADSARLWVFHASGAKFAGGVFPDIASAEAWITRHHLTGTLTAYPVGEGCFDWAVRSGMTGLSEEKLRSKSGDAAFVGGFTSASQEHVHYEDGCRA
ncbi:MAG TPA: hypothetical protein VLE43_03750 [Candidatus Saccharimonadia bacterium]|nr:hypothetical protein [Candidatus Saccharimonadia bacterium]